MLLLQESERKFASATLKDYKAMKRGRDWSTWMKVGAVLEIFSRYAMMEAHTQDRQNPTFKKAFSAILKDEGYADLDPSVRSHLLYLMEPEHRVICDMLREAMSPMERLRVGHPDSMYKRVLNYVRKRDGEALQAKAKKVTEIKAKDALIADLEEQLAAIDVDPDLVARNWLERKSAAGIARVMVEVDPEKAQQIMVELGAALDNAKAFAAP